MDYKEEPSVMESEVFNQHVRKRLEKIGKLCVKRKYFSFSNSLTTSPPLKKRRILFMSPDSFQFEPNQVASSSQMLPSYNDPLKNYHCSFLSDRFFLCADVQHFKLDSFILYDLFHGQKRKIINLDINITFSSAPSFEVIDSNRVLMSISIIHNHQECFCIVLIHVNFKSGSCSCIDKILDKFGEYQLFLETTTRQNFVLYKKFGRTLKFGRIKGNKIDLDKDPIDFELNFVCLHFIGNNFYGLKLNENVVKLYEFQLDFETRTVNLNKTTDVNGIKIDIFDLLFFDFSVHAASDTRLYLCPNKPNLIKSLYHFNLQTGSINEISRLCFTKHISTIHVNEDEILSICTKDDDSKYKVLRIPTKRPEKLETIALLEAKQMLMFDNSTRLHGKLIEMLPYQMKPFYLKSVF